MSLTARWVALLVAVAACGWLVARAPIATDIAAFLPGPATPEQRLLAEQLRDGIAARLLLIGVSVPDAASSERPPVSRQDSRAGCARIRISRSSRAAMPRTSSAIACGCSRRVIC